MKARDRILALFSGEIPDRIGKAEAPWPETRRRWNGEGLPAGVHANDHFGMDIRNMIRIDCSLSLPVTVVEERADHRLVRNAEGVTEKQWKHTGVPHAVDFLLKNATDWTRLRDHLTPSVERIGFGYYGDYGPEYTQAPFARVRECYEQRVDRDAWLMIGCVDPYEAFLAKMGDDRLLTLLVTEPDFVTELFTHYTRFLTAQIDLVLDHGFRADGLFIGGDLAYKNGMLFSPRIYRDLLMPCHKRIFRHVHERGLKVFFHTDGNCMEAIPLLIESGIDALNPLEVAAGMDLETVVGTFGKKLALIGNIGVQALTGGEPSLRAEVERKVRFAVKHRVPYVYHSDHSLPPIPLRAMELAMALVEDLGRY